MDLFLATQNHHKVREIRAIWRDLGVTILSLADLPQPVTLREEGVTLEANAKQKAIQVSGHVKGIVLADDSGIEVDALGGAPGVFSARYAGPRATDADNNRKLLAALADIPWEKRQGRFRCVIALLDRERNLHLTEGVCEGMISFEPAGDNGFGYDPLFYLTEYSCTMAQLPEEVKNRISHRAQALARAKIILTGLLSG